MRFTPILVSWMFFTMIMLGAVVYTITSHFLEYENFNCTAEVIEYIPYTPEYYYALLNITAGNVSQHMLDTRFLVKKEIIAPYNMSCLVWHCAGDLCPMIKLDVISGTNLFHIWALVILLMIGFVVSFGIYVTNHQEDTYMEYKRKEYEDFDLGEYHKA